MISSNGLIRAANHNNIMMILLYPGNTVTVTAYHNIAA
jgi:hypothetical protein